MALPARAPVSRVGGEGPSWESYLSWARDPAAEVPHEGLQERLHLACRWANCRRWPWTCRGALSEVEVVLWTRSLGSRPVQFVMAR